MAINTILIFKRTIGARVAWRIIINAGGHASFEGAIWAGCFVVNHFVWYLVITW